MPTLDELNALPPDGAYKFFISCCGSSRWALSMASCRPYWSVQVVFNAADVIWQCLVDDDRREALQHRPAIGGEELPHALREDLEYYRTKFGYEFSLAPPLPANTELEVTVRRRLEYPARAEFELACGEELATLRGEIRRKVTG